MLINNSLAVLVSVFLFTSHSFASERNHSALQPNIVFILIDDLGIDWVSAYGAAHSTPNIDSLASKGVRFGTAWTAPICTPSRVTILTGRYNGYTGWTEHYDVPRWGGEGLSADLFPTWPQLLDDAGYTTAIVGKWQINDLRLEPDILKQHGFDRHCVWPGVESDNPQSEERYWDPYLQIDGVRRIHRGAYGPDVCQAFALQFLRENHDRPFLLFYPKIDVHDPIEPTPWNRENPPDELPGLFGDAVTYMDHHIGEILDEIDALGVSENTIVVFMGDNGSLIGGIVNGRQWSRGKSYTTNAGVQVPLVVRAPMYTRGGWATEALVDSSDLFPTLLEMSGLSQAGFPTDGHSLVPLLQRREDYRPREWIYAQRGDNRVVRDQRYKLDSDGRFFDLNRDPDELEPIDPHGSVASKTSHEKLSSVLERIPATAKPPFAEYSSERLEQYLDNLRRQRDGAIERE
ncbi:sulfatase-like hydrolase/transferase [Pelagicoccus mobilis]|uniref:Sulfatase-like hydrolase/transferase n=1 Tax=Pelagicoccus mobilis TaxID=415221 RepID=A0A934VQ28_9BACT|nr:sulfatase-like hydrolase/transferase [Pelagicoccus mobilis]MBK1876128.1 sulfatase-like hydrolase/transferase [Pelagicoccus mobilis]